MRRAAGAGASEGVILDTDLRVTQRAGGAGMAVDVAAGEARVQGDNVARQGLYHVVQTTALTGATELTVTSNASGNPRIDSVFLRVYDDLYDGSGFNKATAYVQAGTPSAGATLTNRTGAPALPSSTMLLADILVASGAASIANAVISDKRSASQTVVPFATALPATPPDGYEVALQVDTAAAYGGPYIWHCRYRAATAGSYKWHVMGGSPLYAGIDTTEGMASSTPADLATVGPSIVLPFSGDYDMKIECDGANNSGVPAYARMHLNVGGSTSANDAITVYLAAGAGPVASISKTLRKTGVAATTTVKATYAAPSSTAVLFSLRKLRVTPLRLG